MSFSELDKSKSLPTKERDYTLNFADEILKEVLIFDFGRLILQVKGEQENVSLTSVIFTTSLEHYQDLIKSNLTNVIYRLSDFTLNPFDAFEKFNSKYLAEHQVESLIRDVINETGNYKTWTKQHNFILSYQIQEPGLFYSNILS